MSMWSQIAAPFRRFFGWDVSSPPQWVLNWLRGDDNDDNPSDSGVTVNAKTVLTYAPVWMGVNKICSIASQLPLGVFERVGPRESEERPDHPGAYAMDYPNDLMDSM